MQTITNLTEWQKALASSQGRLRSWLLRNYGDRAEPMQNRLSKFREILAFAAAGPYFQKEQGVLLGRTPCRARVFGGHTDFKGCGGYLINLAGNLEMVYAGQARKDDKVILRDANPQMKSCEFSLCDWDVKPDANIRTPEDWDQWCMKIEEKKKTIFRAELEKKGNVPEDGFAREWTRFREENWQEFVKGILAFLQTDLGDPQNEIRGKLSGFSASLHSEIPMGWGLSSSSALVMSVARLVNSLFVLNLSDDRIVNLGLCEHYNGTKGGMNDHASIIKGMMGKILLMRSFPEEVVEFAEFPKGVSLFLADSKVKRSQAPELSGKFKREKIKDAAVVLARTGIGYVLGSLWVRHHFPEYREALSPRPEKTNDTNGLLREFNRKGSIVFPGEEHRTREIYRMLASMPVRISRRSLLDKMPGFKKELEAVFLTHPEPSEGYRLRDMALYGLAENERSFEYMARANQGDFSGMLELMRIAHNGDRAAKFEFDLQGNAVEKPFDAVASDKELQEWTQCPEGHPIWGKPGVFERSIEPVDYLCDLIDSHFKGMATGRVAGAGLGGAVTVLAKSESVQAIRNFLEQKGYPSIPPFTPSSGASVVELE